MKRVLFVLLLLVVLLVLFVLVNPFKLSISSPQISTMKLSSSVFIDGQRIPDRYTCKGEGINPPLEIADIPSGTQSLVLILKDPDAPLETFIHWLVWNIPPGTVSISENSLPQGSIQGKNSVDKNSYFNPCPPSGQHHYVFYLYALDTTLTLPSEATAKELEQVIVGHSLGVTTLTGIYP